MSDEHLTSKAQADEYRVKWPTPLGPWIVAHVSDATGVLSICSDWGSWGHRWNVASLEQPLTAFLTRLGPGDCEYFASKLIPHPRQKRLDVAASKRAMKEGLCWMRRRRTISSDDARDCWHEIEEWDGGRDLPCSWAMTSHDYLCKVPTDEWRTVVNVVLPALIDCIREHRGEADR